MKRRFMLICIAFMVVLMQIAELPAQKPKKKAPPEFKWVNVPRELPEGVRHGVFQSPSMKQPVGYCIYLPPSYETDENRRYPVVYYLHGGRPGNEAKSIGLANYIHKYMSQAKTAEMIYVFINGGPVSHYNLADRENAMGENVFVKELIPFIDHKYRTIADRRGRGIEGFSQGGRGTTRIIFKHPDLFCSAAPGGSGYATEKRISEENGRESKSLVFAPGDNTWDLAREYAKTKKPPVRIMLHVGTKGFNYENNLEFMQFLHKLNVPFQSIIVKDAPHSAQKIYDKRGLDLVQFHAENFRQSGDLSEE